MAVPQASRRPPTPPAAAPGESLLGAVEALPSALGGVAVRLFIEPNAPYHLAQPPDAWDIERIVGRVGDTDLDGAYLLPQLVARPEVPGSAPGFRTLKQGESPERAYIEAHRRMREDGWTVLDRNRVIASVFLPPGLAEGPYVRRMPCRGPAQVDGYYHFDAWNVPRRMPPGQPQRFTFDRERYNLWRASLVLEGIVPAPSDYATEAALAIAKSRLRRVEVQNWASPDLRKMRIDGARATLDLVTSARPISASSASRGA